MRILRPFPFPFFFYFSFFFCLFVCFFFVSLFVCLFVCLFLSFFLSFFLSSHKFDSLNGRTQPYGIKCMSIETRKRNKEAFFSLNASWKYTLTLSAHYKILCLNNIEISQSLIELESFNWIPREAEQMGLIDASMRATFWKRLIMLPLT